VGLQLERDDGHIGPAMGVESFFADHGDWAEPERSAFEFVEGRVLDIGAGAGRHSLVAQRQGLETVAIDISPGAVEVCRERGVRDVRLLPVAEIDQSLGVFDTVLLLCGNFGLAGSAEETLALLEKLHSLTSPGARIVLDTVDPYVDSDEADLAYIARNLERGRMPGQFTIRIRYAEKATPWYDLLCVGRRELVELLDGTGWNAVFLREGGTDVYAVLEKA
jgi:SAM-dependent methyltransferase